MFSWIAYVAQAKIFSLYIPFILMYIIYRLTKKCLMSIILLLNLIFDMHIARYEWRYQL